MLHLFALLLAISALVLLVVFASIVGGALHVVSFSLYGGSLVLFYLIRTLYVHSAENTPNKTKLQKLDHTMIFVLTAATYTPIALLLPQRAWAWSIFGVVWGFTVLASLFRFHEVFDKKHITTSFYFVLLLVDLIAFTTLHRFLSPSAFLWLGMGGIAYLLETLLVVYRPKIKMSRLLLSHEHLAFPFLVLGSACHFWAFFNYVL